MKMSDSGSNAGFLRSEVSDLLLRFQEQGGDREGRGGSQDAKLDRFWFLPGGLRSNRRQLSRPQRVGFEQTGDRCLRCDPILDIRLPKPRQQLDGEARCAPSLVQPLPCLRQPTPPHRRRSRPRPPHFRRRHGSKRARPRGALQPRVL